MEKTPEYENAVERIRGLLRDWINSGIDLFLELRSVEQSMVWCDLHKDFEAFLRSEFPNALGIVRYRHVINALEQHGEEMVRKVGVQSCHALVSTQFDLHPEKKAVLHEVIERHLEERHAPPDADFIADQRRAILGEVKQTRAIRALSREAQLAAQVNDLKSQLRAANAKIKALERENEKLRKKAA